MKIATCEGSACAFGNFTKIPLIQAAGTAHRRVACPVIAVKTGGMVLPPGGLLDDRSNSSLYMDPE